MTNILGCHLSSAAWILTSRPAWPDAPRAGSPGGRGPLDVFLTPDPSRSHREQGQSEYAASPAISEPAHPLLRLGLPAEPGLASPTVLAGGNLWEPIHLLRSGSGTTRSTLIPRESTATKTISITFSGTRKASEPGRLRCRSGRIYGQVDPFVDYYLRCHCPNHGQRSGRVRQEADHSVQDSRDIQDNTDFYHLFSFTPSRRSAPSARQRSCATIDAAISRWPTQPNNARVGVGGCSKRCSRVATREASTALLQVHRPRRG